MRTRIICIAAAMLLVPAVAHAQETAEPPAAATETAAEDGGSGDVAGWFRIDTDALGTALWAGAVHPVGGFDLASNVFLLGSWGELDIGPSFAFGKVLLTPMVGFGFDFYATDFTTLVGHLYTIYDADKIYFESWIQLFMNTPFAPDNADPPAEDVLYTRDFLLYKLSDTIHAGVQVELSYGLTEAEDTLSLPIGARVNLAYGKNNTLGLFLGYETEAPDGADGIAGRFTLIRTW